MHLLQKHAYTVKLLHAYYFAVLLLILQASSYIQLNYIFETRPAYQASENHIFFAGIFMPRSGMVASYTYAGLSVARYCQR